MSKPKRERSLPENEAKAVARMLRVSPQKLNLVAQLIRGRKAAAALADLQFSRKRIAVDVKKCLESAIANAENNHDLDVDDLVVSEAHVGKGMVSLQQFETKDAETHADQALKINARLTSALRLKADVLLLGGDVGTARKLLEKAKEARPREETTLARLAACARVQNKPDEVKAVAKPCLRHRVMVRPELEIEGTQADAVLDGILATLPTPR